MYLLRNLRMISKIKQKKLSAFLLRALVLGLLSSLLWAVGDRVFAAEGLDTSAATAGIKELVIPAVTWASEWGTKVGFGLVGAQLFYTIVIRLVKD